MELEFRLQSCAFGAPERCIAGCIDCRPGMVGPPLSLMNRTIVILFQAGLAICWRMRADGIIHRGHHRGVSASRRILDSANRASRASLACMGV